MSSWDGVQTDVPRLFRDDMAAGRAKVLDQARAARSFEPAVVNDDLTGLVVERTLNGVRVRIEVEVVDPRPLGDHGAVLSELGFVRRELHAVAGWAFQSFRTRCTGARARRGVADG